MSGPITGSPSALQIGASIPPAQSSEWAFNPLCLFVAFANIGLRGLDSMIRLSDGHPFHHLHHLNQGRVAISSLRPAERQTPSHLFMVNRLSEPLRNFDIGRQSVFRSLSQPFDPRRFRLQRITSSTVRQRIPLRRASDPAKRSWSDFSPPLFSSLQAVDPSMLATPAPASWRRRKRRRGSNNSHHERGDPSAKTHDDLAIREEGRHR